MSKIVHQDVMQLQASPEQVLAFVLTPERIMDYFPSPLECGTFIEGKSIWCSGKSGVCLLEFNSADSKTGQVTLNVYNARIPKPYTPEAIRAKSFMNMTEDWQAEADGDGTRLTKTWRDVKCFGFMKLLPMGMIIRMTAKSEHKKLVDAWNFHAQKTTSA